MLRVLKTRDEYYMRSHRSSNPAHSAFPGRGRLNPTRVRLMQSQLLLAFGLLPRLHCLGRAGAEGYDGRVKPEHTLKAVLG